eukprot:1728614-Amphidinium_carterae.1
MEADEERIYDLSEEHIEYITHLPSDTADDDIRLRQLQDLDDDIQYDRVERGECNAMDEEYNIPDYLRAEQARDRQERRDERKRRRFKGSLEELKTMREALHGIIITGRRQRL